MSQTYDFVIVGAGSNGLTTAAYLAAGGYSVAVLEQHEYIGGGCVTREVTLSGFKHDTHATNIFLVKANPLIKNDELGLLERFGLEYVKSEKAYHGSFFEDGSVIEVFTDLEKTCASIAKLNTHDAQAYREFGQRTADYVDILSWGMFAPPSDPATFVEVLNQSDEGRYMLELMNQSAWDLINTTFEDERVKTHLYRKTAEMMILPEKPGTALAMFMIVGFSHRFTSGAVVGGSQGFSDALGRCIEYHGGKIFTGKKIVSLNKQGETIKQVISADGECFTARKAVIAAIPPWSLQHFIDDFEPELIADAEQTRSSDFGVFLSSYALKDNMTLNYPPEQGYIQINQFCGGLVSDIRTAFKKILDGKVPSGDDFFFGNGICATILDPSRAPDGHGTLYLYHMVPLRPDGNIDNWDDLKAPFTQWLRTNASRFITNLGDGNIMGEHHESPKDMAAYSPSFRYGDVMGAGTYADQFLGGRPSKTFADFRVPGIDNLYLVGPFMHPGGGVGGGGRSVAMKVMFDLDLDLDRAFTYY